MKLQWVLRRLPPPTPTTTLLLPPPAQQQEEVDAGVTWPPPSLGQATLTSTVMHDQGGAWLINGGEEKQFTVEDEDGEEDEEEDENDDVTSWSESWIRRGHIKAGDELDWFTTSPTSLTATTTTSTLKCRSQKSWHSDLVCFLCNKRNFQKEFLVVFFLKDCSNFKRNYYYILVTLYCQYIWPV